MTLSYIELEKSIRFKYMIENLADCCLVVVNKKLTKNNFLRILQRNHKLRLRQMVSRLQALCLRRQNMLLLRSWLLLKMSYKIHMSVLRIM